MALANSPSLPLSLALLLLCAPALAQPIQGNGNDFDQITPVQPDSPAFEARRRSGCNRTFRTFDGSCTNFGTPDRKLWGSTNRPHFSYFASRDTLVPRGTSLPSPRLISNLLCAQSSDVLEPRRLNEFTTFFGQFIDHTIVATTTNKVEPMPIPIPRDDPIMANFSKGQLPFFRSVRVRVRTRDMTQRPSNTLTSLIDLDSIYGASRERCNSLRAPHGGLLKTGPGGMLPLNRDNLNNAPRSGPQFFISGDHRANEHPLLTALHTIFFREHNSIARELKRKFKSWSDERIFQTARKINGAQMQKIVFNQWYPAITGKKLRPYRGFDPNVDPTVSLSFSTAAFRVGHTMVGNRINRRGKGNVILPSFSLTKMFFRPANEMKDLGIDDFVRGAIQNQAQKIDLKVHDSLRNFLFTGIDGEDGLDLIAMNIQRGRDHALPTFNALRVQFGIPKAVTFDQISKNRNVQSALQNVYKSAGLVEAWPGLVAEDRAPGSSMGPTMLALWRREFSRLRDGDSFYYEANGAFSNKLKAKIPRVRALFDSLEDTIRSILLRNTGIVESELSKRMFFVD